MMIGNLNSVGVWAGSNYPSSAEEVKPVGAVSFEQRDTQNFLQSDYAETIQPVVTHEPAGEKPDFAAINLMKNSFPEPVPMQHFTIEDFETGVSSTGEPQMTLEDFRVQQEQRAQQETQENTPDVQEAIENGGSYTEAQTTNDNFNVQEMNTPAWEPLTTVDLNNPATITQEARTEERIADSATVQTSHEIAQESVGNSQLTPAQQQGVEEYTRVQNYTDPTSVSMAGTQIAA
jgi:hypothetical protein